MEDGNKIAKQCKHAIGGKVNEIGEILCFCELSDNLENALEIVNHKKSKLIV